MPDIDGRPGPGPGREAGAGSQAAGHRHDRFFKAVVGKPENAASLLRHVLPAELAGEMDLERLEPAPTEYVSAILQERALDVAFIAPMGEGEAFVHFLVDAAPVRE